ncbi:MAG TPA: alpha/beta hydrolase [Solirubrobacteraceae bacterium]|jgi:pimeloyl-ACP methyl ester carboxylesterase|nr:alpha/beta hydrolase [Solirubrobacteraceae bacterium]
MTEQIARSNGLDIAHETFGDPGDPPLLLVMGLAAQMLLWREELCELLAERGFFVIRFDNRDVGRSSKTAGPPPRIWPALLGRRVDAAYTLDDLADDAVGLLDELGIEAAHVVGASMGGMIAQTIAARHPDRVLSLTSIMSTTGDRKVGRARRRMLPILLRRARSGRARNVARAVRVFRAIGSPGFPFDEESVRELAGRSYDRCFHPAGAAHQLAAILASGDRTTALRSIRAPTLVIHGTDDPLVDVSGARATAAAIPDAQLMLIDGMGHDLPRQLWPRIVDAIRANADRAGDPGVSGGSLEAARRASG